ncbi:MAG: rod-binding protein [Bdellovibrionales bacterium]|nr:rod-binding protein [Bdellovibrionales bacterium]
MGTKIGSPNADLLANVTLAQSRKAEQQLSSLKRLTDSTKDTSKVDRRQKIENAAEDFEALMLNEMLKSMWKTIPQDGMFSGGNEEAYYRDMLNQALAESISKQNSIGIKEVIVEDLEKREPK